MSIDSDQLGDVSFIGPGVVMCAEGGPNFLIGFRLPEEWAKAHGSSNIFMCSETLQEYLDARRAVLQERGDRPMDDFSYKQAARAITTYSQDQAARRDGEGAAENDFDL